MTPSHHERAIPARSQEGWPKKDRPKKDRPVKVWPVKVWPIKIWPQDAAGPSPAPAKPQKTATAFARIRSSAKRLLQQMALALAMALAPALTLALAPAIVAAQSQSITVIGNDRGGLVGERARIVDGLRAGGQRIEIRGNLCYSACTMYLGAGNVCVSPNTTFGFHGPSRNGTPLPPDSFDHWSRVMARYYNEPLRQWFMTQARYSQSNPYRLSGQQIINLGYQQC